MVKQKYKLAKNLIQENIMNSEINDPKTYWKLIKQLKEQKNSNCNAIQINEWTNYFD